MIKITSCNNRCGIKTHTQYKDIKIVQFYYNSIYNNDYIQDTEINLEDTEAYIQGYDTHFEVSIGSQYLNYVPDLSLSYVIVNGVVKKAEFGNVEEVIDETSGSGNTKYVVNVTLKNFHIKDEDSIKIILYYEQTIPGIFKYTIVGDAEYNTTTKTIYEASVPTDDIFRTGGTDANYDEVNVISKVYNNIIMCNITCSNDNRSNDITSDMFYNFKPYKVYITISNGSTSSTQEITSDKLTVVSKTGAFRITLDALPNNIQSIECQYYATVPKLQNIYGVAHEEFNSSRYSYIAYAYLLYFMPSNIWNFIDFHDETPDDVIIHNIKDPKYPYVFCYSNSTIKNTNSTDKYVATTTSINNDLLSLGANCLPYTESTSTTGTSLSNGYLIKLNNNDIYYYIRIYEEFPDSNDILQLNYYLTKLYFKYKPIKTINRYSYSLSSAEPRNGGNKVIPLSIQNNVLRNQFISQAIIPDNAAEDTTIYTSDTTDSGGTTHTQNAYPLSYLNNDNKPINAYYCTTSKDDDDNIKITEFSIPTTISSTAVYLPNSSQTFTTYYYEINNPTAFLLPKINLNEENDNVAYNLFLIIKYTTNIQ